MQKQLQDTNHDMICVAFRLRRCLINQDYIDKSLIFRTLRRHLFRINRWEAALISGKEQTEFISPQISIDFCGGAKPYQLCLSIEREKMYWYVLFIKTGREKSAEQYLKKRLGDNEFLPFVPVVEKIIKDAHEIRKEKNPLFPGYLFVKTELPDAEFVLRTKRVLFESKNIISILRHADKNEHAMQEEDKDLITRLCNDEYCVEASSGIIIGTRVYIKNGPLMGLESIIKKIDRHKMRAMIELDVMGAKRQINVALEIVEKIPR